MSTSKLKFAFSSESAEWYTPVRYLELIRLVIGDIELDPASNEYANQRIQAERYFDIETDGLKQEWIAKSIFLNPPYGKLAHNKSQAGAFLNKMIAEYKAEHFKAGIALVNAATGSTWFKPLWEFPICFTDHRIQFDSAPEITQRKQPTHGNAFIYFGKDALKFYSVFSSIGHICFPTGYYIDESSEERDRKWNALLEWVEKK